MLLHPNSPELRLISLPPSPSRKGQPRLTARIPTGRDFDWFRESTHWMVNGSEMVNDADYSRIGGGGGGGA